MTISKSTITAQFSNRLQEAMVAAGHTSQRSTSGIDINKLVDITGYSSQICHKYLRGEAMPDPLKIHDLAKKLGVSPGWLLFGNPVEKPIDFPHHYLHIHQDVLHTLFEKADVLYKTGASATQRASLLTDLARKISQLHADKAQSDEIIDLALSSATHFIPILEHTE